MVKGQIVTAQTCAQCAIIFFFILLFLYDACSRIFICVLLSVGCTLMVSSFLEMSRGLLLSVLVQVLQIN